ncbi:hypothetical protein RRG08_029133 [Elysia crispata]|uniref:Uncharacterized protein n=1 Tax=Elysia crispata TaxID=231223 RepID=A0AAE0Y691_9GAST|nr:hypothetical protein RRG08_029133 [Elysia crispata]
MFELNVNGYQRQWAANILSNFFPNLKLLSFVSKQTTMHVLFRTTCCPLDIDSCVRVRVSNTYHYDCAHSPLELVITKSSTHQVFLHRSKRHDYLLDRCDLSRYESVLHQVR